MPEATPVDAPIVVFISSHQKEFQDLRDALGNAIDSEDFLKKYIMEAELVDKRSGTRIHGDIRAALQRSTIYIGIFGDEYSEDTKLEYLEARRRGLPIIVFDVVPAKRTKGKRDSRVEDFLTSQVKKLDDVRVTRILTRPSRPGEVLNIIIQRLANVVTELVQQNLTVRKTVNPQ